MRRLPAVRRNRMEIPPIIKMHRQIGLPLIRPLKGQNLPVHINLAGFAIG